MPSPKSAQTSVVKFPAKSRSRAPLVRRAKWPNHPDDVLIGACVAYAYAMGGIRAAFPADPTGDKDFVQSIDGHALLAARRNMHRAANLFASTLDGLRAKAFIVSIVLDNETDTASVSPFLKSLAHDIERLYVAGTLRHEAHDQGSSG
jgi:hypothetical protein